MPAKAPPSGPKLKKLLLELGGKIRERRKELKISATAVAESAGMSRPTLYRIEMGEASVTLGAYLSVIMALGLKLSLEDAGAKKQVSAQEELPKRIKINQYAQLKRLAWQLTDTQEVSPEEALEIYERNWKVVETKKMKAEERELIQKLLKAFGRKRLLV